MSAVCITDIKTTKKGMHALFCGTEFLFSVDDLTLRKYCITIGCSLSDDDLALARADSDYKKAYVKALDYLALRDHAEHELFEKLGRKFDAYTAQAAVDKMRELGYIDDAAFARRYAQELIERKGASKREAERRLLQKGVCRDTAREVLAAYADGESAAITALIEKKFTTKLAAENGPEKVFQALLRRGFSARDIRVAMRELNMDMDEEY